MPTSLSSPLTFFFQVYIPVLFKIKRHPQIFYAALHFFAIVAGIRHLSQVLQTWHRKVLNRNSYAIQPESLLVAMAVHPEEAVRRQAVEIIQKSRANQYGGGGVRLYRKPGFNREANFL